MLWTGLTLFTGPPSRTDARVLTPSLPDVLDPDSSLRAVTRRLRDSRRQPCWRDERVQSPLEARQDRAPNAYFGWIVGSNVGSMTARHRKLLTSLELAERVGWDSVSPPVDSVTYRSHDADLAVNATNAVGIARHCRWPRSAKRPAQAGSSWLRSESERPSPPDSATAPRATRQRGVVREAARIAKAIDSLECMRRYRLGPVLSRSAAMRQTPSVPFFNTSTKRPPVPRVSSPITGSTPRTAFFARDVGWPFQGRVTGSTRPGSPRA